MVVTDPPSVFVFVIYVVGAGPSARTSDWSTRLASRLWPYGCTFHQKHRTVTGQGCRHLTPLFTGCRQASPLRCFPDSIAFGLVLSGPLPVGFYPGNVIYTYSSVALPF
jgi:hypothetical protein